MRAILTVGIASSGKSTWAREFESKNPSYTIVCRDDIRREMMGGHLVWAKWQWGREGEVTNTHESHMRHAHACGLNIIVADTNLNAKNRAKVQRFLESLGYEVEIKDFPITLEQAWKRDAQREGGVGHDILAKQWQQWLEYINHKKYVPDISKPEAIIVDIDGTLAHMDGRSPYDWDKVHTDKVDSIVKSIVKHFHETKSVIIVSGRDGACKDITQDWLTDNCIPYNELFMREAKDQRKDSIVKSEIFWRDIAPYYNVECVIDDRPQVVRMWLDLGLKVLCVGNPWIEF